MDQMGLKKFVENMRSQAMPDDEIERNLQIAGHKQEIIDSLLGKTPDQVAGKEKRQDDSPIIDPNNRPQIIKDRMPIVEGAEPPQDEQPIVAAAESPAERRASAASPKKLTLTPESSDLEPATINSPTTKAVEEPLEQEQPATPAQQPTTPVGMPAPPPQAIQQEAAQPIYPDATRGRSGYAQATQQTAPAEATPQESYPDFISNPLALFLYSSKEFFKNAPYMLVAVFAGSALSVGFLKTGALVLNNATKWTTGIADLFSLGSDNIYVNLFILLSILTVFYSVVVSIFITLWRTIQLSIALDIVKEDKPSLGGAFSRLFGWFGRIFHANFRLVLKYVLAFDAIFAASYWIVTQRVAQDGLGALVYFLWAFYIWLAVILVISLRNSFVHMLMLDNGTNRARDASSDSIQLVRQPRQKYIELLAWIGIGTTLYGVTRVAMYLIFKEDPLADLNIFDTLLSSSLNVDESLIAELTAVLVTVFTTALYDIGLARHFISSKGMLKTAKQPGSIHPLNFVVILVAIGSIFASNWAINEARQRNLQAELESYNSSQQESSPSTVRPQRTDYDDWDDNGVPDDEQCGPGEFAVPRVQEYNEEARYTTYRIDCI